MFTSIFSSESEWICRFLTNRPQLYLCPVSFIPPVAIGQQHAIWGPCARTLHQIWVWWRQGTRHSDRCYIFTQWDWAMTSIVRFFLGGARLDSPIWNHIIRMSMMSSMCSYMFILNVITSSSGAVQQLRCWNLQWFLKLQSFFGFPGEGSFELEWLII